MKKKKKKKLFIIISKGEPGYMCLPHCMAFLWRFKTFFVLKIYKFTILQIYNFSNL
jgi:hypothetical protein